MNPMKLIRTISLPLALVFLSSSIAQAAECHLRKLAFVGLLPNGGLIANAELYNATNGEYLGYLANSTYCSVNGYYNDVAPATCQGWYSILMAAMLSNKMIYINAAACTPGNGISLPGIGVIGLNH